MPNHHLKDSINKLINKLYSKKGAEFAAISSNWNQIAGDDISKNSIPIDMKYYKTQNGKERMLVLSVSNNSKILELQFSTGIIIERVNNYLGFKAISKVKLK